MCTMGRGKQLRSRTLFLQGEEAERIGDGAYEDCD